MNDREKLIGVSMKKVLNFIQSDLFFGISAACWLYLAHDGFDVSPFASGICVGIFICMFGSVVVSLICKFCKNQKTPR